MPSNTLAYIDINPDHKYFVPINYISDSPDMRNGSGAVFSISLAGQSIEERQDYERKFIEELAIKKKLLMKKGLPDTKRAARLILSDWQKGKIKEETDISM